MQLKILKSWGDKVSSNFKQQYRYKDKDAWIHASSSDFSPEELEALQSLAEGTTGNRDASVLVSRLKLLRNLSVDVKTTKVSKLDGVPDAIRGLFSSRPRKWLVKEENDGQLLAWYLESAIYHENDRYQPARVVVTLVAHRMLGVYSESFTVHREHIHRPVEHILNRFGFYLETDDFHATYEQQVTWYGEIHTKIGFQFSATGKGFYPRSVSSMLRDGSPAKVVVDLVEENAVSKLGGSSRERSSKSRAEITFWNPNADDEDDVNNLAVDIPFQPYLPVFDLERHETARIHASYLSTYVWNPTLADKLVLPDAHRDLVTLLLDGADLILEDIVTGKSAGVIVISTGPAGTGKTLTAEVFSERVQKPLYKVQCSQLGTDEEALEESLKSVLTRAERWKAILLIDEADVYIHERGEDIQQNAIVGVFLRILEYYKGILFMTSNRETVIDDAIMSRATAWLRYERPNQASVRKLWEVLSKQYGVDFDSATIEKLTEKSEFKGISGRSIKNLLRLSRFVANQQKTTVTAKTIDYVAQFLDIGDVRHQ